MRPIVLSSSFLCLVALVGCGSSSPYSSSVYPVSGKVVGPAGEPVRGGAEIILTPKAKDGKVFGTEGSALLDPDGSFVLKSGDGQHGVPGGYYLVVVRPYGTGKSSEKQAATRSIPKKYWSEDTSDLAVEIKEAKTGWEVKLP